MFKPFAVLLVREHLAQARFEAAFPLPVPHKNLVSQCFGSGNNGPLHSPARLPRALRRDALPIDLFFLEKQQGASDELPFEHDCVRFSRSARTPIKRTGPQSPRR
ncbi:hypothetical protein J4P02_22895 [Pseudomonas sp. NFXW11]